MLYDRKYRLTSFQDDVIVVRMPSKRRRVLLLDDDALAIQGIRCQLESLGWEVVSFNSGEEAVGAIHKGLRVDLLLAGIHLPGMSGAPSVIRAILAEAVLDRHRR